MNPTHLYISAGTYTVVLTATGPSGTSTKTRTNYVVVAEPPVIYWKGINSDWNDPNNWYLDSAGTVPSPYAPWLASDAHYLASDLALCDSAIETPGITSVLSANVTGTCNLHVELSGGSVYSGKWQSNDFYAYSGSIYGGMYESLLFVDGATIYSGTFNSEVNLSSGEIYGGTFNGIVYTSGEIYGGTFNDYVENSNNIWGGTFNSDFVNGSGSFVYDGNFNGAVTNNAGAGFYGGFVTSSSFTNYGTVSGPDVDYLSITVTALMNYGFIWGGYWAMTSISTESGEVHGGTFLTADASFTVYNTDFSSQDYPLVSDGGTIYIDLATCLNAYDPTFPFSGINGGQVVLVEPPNGLLNSLEAYWTFSAPPVNGVYYYDVTGNHTLDVAANQPSDATGIVDTALVFGQNSPDYLVGDAIFVGMDYGHDAVTINYWAQYQSTIIDSSSAAYQLLNVDQNSGIATYQAYCDPSGDFGYFKNDEIGTVNLNGDVYDRWIMFTAVRLYIDNNGGYWLFYVDGALVLEGYDNGIYSYTSTHYLGNDSSEGYGWIGSVCGLGIWSTALSVTQINQLYNNGNGLSYSHFTT
jgi:PKD repeat protein